MYLKLLFMKKKLSLGLELLEEHFLENLYYEKNFQKVNYFNCSYLNRHVQIFNLANTDFQFFQCTVLVRNLRSLKFALYFSLDIFSYYQMINYYLFPIFIFLELSCFFKIVCFNLYFTTYCSTYQKEVQILFALWKI